MRASAEFEKGKARLSREFGRFEGAKKLLETSVTSCYPVGASADGQRAIKRIPAKAAEIHIELASEG